MHKISCIKAFDAEDLQQLEFLAVVLPDVFGLAEQLQVRFDMHELQVSLVADEAFDWNTVIHESSETMSRVVQQHHILQLSV